MQLATAAGVWMAAQVHWLMWAYLLEFEGRQVFLGVWAASMVFLCANTWLLFAAVQTFKPSKSFKELSIARRAESKKRD
jgi:GPI mannosyltransferase 1 subunit M